MHRESVCKACLNNKEKYQLADVRKVLYPLPLSACVCLLTKTPPPLCGRPLWTAPKRNFNMTLVENQYDDSLLQRVNEAQFLYDATWKPITMMIATYSEFIKRTTNMMIPFYSALIRRKINMTLEQGCRDPF